MGRKTNAKIATQLNGALGRGAFISNSTPETLGGINGRSIHYFLHGLSHSILA